MITILKKYSELVKQIKKIHKIFTNICLNNLLTIYEPRSFLFFPIFLLINVLYSFYTVIR